MNEDPSVISIRFDDVASLRSYSCQAMACTFNFYLIGDNSGLMDSAVMEAEERLSRLEEQLSFYIEYSDITRINRAPLGEGIRISQDAVDCLLQSFEASARLGGKFHPFLGQANTLHKGQQNELPHLADLLVKETDSSEPAISLDQENNTVVKLRSGPLLDLGGIGKGFALDQLQYLFQEWEIEQGLIECGGSTFLAMQPPDDASSWGLTIGYENRVGTISLAANQVLASSGDAFQGSHVIDPSTRSPTYNWKRSYAIAPRAALADAASTGALLLDTKSLETISQQDPDLSFALFSNDSEFHCGLHFECLSES